MALALRSTHFFEALLQVVGQEAVEHRVGAGVGVRQDDGEEVDGGGGAGLRDDDDQVDHVDDEEGQPAEHEHHHDHHHHLRHLALRTPSLGEAHPLPRGLDLRHKQRGRASAGPGQGHAEAEAACTAWHLDDDEQVAEADDEQRAEEAHHGGVEDEGRGPHVLGLRPVHVAGVKRFLGATTEGMASAYL